MSMMVRTLAAAALCLSLSTPVRAESQAGEAGMSALCAFGNLLYFPAKVVVAGTGLVAGGVVGALSGGDERAAYALWVPTVGGDYMLRTDHCVEDAPVRFLGSDYADRPSAYGHGADRTYGYDALYQTRD